MKISHNTYMFDKIVNPAYLDALDCNYPNYVKIPPELDCPYLNYVRAPTALDSVHEHNSTSVQDNVSGYIDSEDEWNALPENSKREYINTLSKMVKNDSSESDEINEKNMVENYPNKDNKWGTVIFMIIITVVVNLIMWYVLNNKN